MTYTPGNPHEASTEVREIFDRYGLNAKGSSIQLLQHYYPEMDRETQRRADITMLCLEFGEAFHAIR